MAPEHRPATDAARLSAPCRAFRHRLTSFRGLERGDGIGLAGAPLRGFAAGGTLPCIDEDVTMIDPEFMAILACPQTHTPLRAADDAVVRRANELIEAGALVTRDGRTVGEKWDGALVREDGAVLYPIIEGIPILLIEESVSTEALSLTPARLSSASCLASSASCM